ncbi:MAG: Ig-like domain-containing protein [Bacillota bacterium]
MKKKIIFSILVVMVFAVAGLAYAMYEESPYDGRTYNLLTYNVFYINDGTCDRKVGELYCPTFGIIGADGKVVSDTGYAAVDASQLTEQLKRDFFGLVDWPKKQTGLTTYYLISGQDWGQKVNYLTQGAYIKTLPYVRTTGDSYTNGRAYHDLRASYNNPIRVYEANLYDINDPSDIVSDGQYFYYVMGTVDGALRGWKGLETLPKGTGPAVQSIVDGYGASGNKGGYGDIRIQFTKNLTIWSPTLRNQYGSDLLYSVMYARPQMPYVPDHAKTTLRAYLQHVSGGTPQLVKQVVLSSSLNNYEIGALNKDQIMNTWNVSIPTPNTKSTVIFTINKRYEGGRWIDEDLYLKSWAGGTLQNSIVFAGPQRETTYDDNICTALIDPANLAVQPGNARLVVEPSIKSVEVGKSTSYTATVLYSNGTSLNVTSTSAWSTADTTIATAASGGSVTGVTQGSTQVIAKYNDPNFGLLQGNATINVFTTSTTTNITEVNNLNQEGTVSYYPLKQVQVDIFREEQVLVPEYDQITINAQPPPKIKVYIAE